MKIWLFTLCLFSVSCYQNADKSKAVEKEVLSTAVEKPLSYEETIENVERARLAFKKRYRQADDTAKKAIVLADAGNYLLKTIGTDFWVYWQGTPWDFNGTTTAPKQGTIACGYFVTTLLQAAGYTLNRIKLSTCPSLTMMQQLTSSSTVKNLSRLKFNEFENRIKESKGLYIVGLDFHTGFIVNDDTGSWFLHANYIGKAGVMKEKLSESAAIQASKTRYIICLTCDDKFLKRWLFH